MPLPFEAVLVLGKAVGRDAERCRRELRARAAAASAAQRAGATTVLSLEAQLRGQSRAGSAIVAEHLTALHVPSHRVVLRETSRSTRDEAVHAAAVMDELGLGPLLVVTSAYHVPRARLIFREVMGHHRATVHDSMGLYALANATERHWILRGEPNAGTLQYEGRVERLLLAAEASIGVLPRGLRWRMESWAGTLWRG